MTADKTDQTAPGPRERRRGSEPDLLPLVVDEKWKAEIARALPELPEERRARMVKDYAITEYDAQVLTFSKSLADQFEQASVRAELVQVVEHGVPLSGKEQNRTARPWNRATAGEMAQAARP